MKPWCVLFRSWRGFQSVVGGVCWSCVPSASRGTSSPEFKDPLWWAVTRQLWVWGVSGQVLQDNQEWGGEACLIASLPVFLHYFLSCYITSSLALFTCITCPLALCVYITSSFALMWFFSVFFFLLCLFCIHKESHCNLLSVLQQIQNYILEVPLSLTTIIGYWKNPVISVTNINVFICRFCMRVPVKMKRLWRRVLRGTILSCQELWLMWRTWGEWLVKWRVPRVDDKR